ncbi:hypothetical protein KC19_4G265400 [Ceratodon purpureus]|uniref:Uncharacterized protein n=1 Tax=Ceratodon purpureus TaxID=3225 RepID=A0A8T0ICZ1_CERPU|nr:hypothetical protein KC19_4G265400 [Ceratodon purpureus]
MSLQGPHHWVYMSSTTTFSPASFTNGQKESLSTSVTPPAVATSTLVLPDAVSALLHTTRGSLARHGCGSLSAHARTPPHAQSFPSNALTATPPLLPGFPTPDALVTAWWPALLALRCTAAMAIGLRHYNADSQQHKLTALDSLSLVE